MFYIKRVISILISLILISNVFTFSSLASTSDEELLFVLEFPLYKSSQQAVTISEEQSSAYYGLTLYDVILNGLMNFEQKIDISGFEIYPNDSNCSAIAFLIFNEMAQAFHIEGSIGFWGTSSTLTAIEIGYIYTPQEYSIMLEEFEARANDMTEDIVNNTALSDVEKALLLHDRLAVNSEYDYDRLINGTIPDISFTAYGALVENTCVCQGYAEAYDYLLEKVGIESYLCTSETLNHAWNMIAIDGVYYHVDVTWDDPVYDVTGRVTHNNFLLSTQALYNNGHTATDYYTIPTDTRYDNYFWQNSLAEFQLIGNEIYYIDNVTRSLKLLGNSNTLCTVETFSLLSSDGEALYYSKNDAIYRFDTEKLSFTEVYRPDTSVGQHFSIYGFKYITDKEGYFIYELYNSPNFTALTKKLYQYKSLDTFKLINNGLGDINGDRKLNALDLLICKGHLLSYETLSASQKLSCDINRDGNLDIRDFVHFKKIMLYI